MKVELSSTQYSLTLVKALRILEILCRDQPDWGVREMGRELDIDPSTTYRLIKTMNAAGYIEQNSANQRYSLGPKVMKLASAYTHKNPLPAIATKVFETYSSQFEYNFYLGELYHFEVIYIAVFDGRGPIQIAIDPGYTLDLHCTALGKTLLAFQSDEYIQEFLNTYKLTGYTPQTITQADELVGQLNTIRIQKFAVNTGEYFSDIGAIGVPVYDHTGKVTMCVSLTYPLLVLEREREYINEMVILAREIADEITLRSVGT